MSWWDINAEGDVIGDEPADIFDEALARLAREREQATGERPSLAGLLAGLGAALSKSGARPIGVMAVTSNGEVRADMPAARAEGEQLLPVLDDAMRQLVASYQERWQRPPRANEVAAAAAFVLGPEPERYLRAADAAGLDLENYVPEEVAA